MNMTMKHNGADSKQDEYVLQKSQTLNGKLVFDDNNGFEKALRDGFFLIKIPKTLSLDGPDTFAQNFYKNKENNCSLENKYRGYHSIGPDEVGDPMDGFQQRKYQIEQFLLERRFWKKYYPEDVTQAGEALCQLSIDIIKNVMEKVNITKADWDKATGGCAFGEGAYHLTFNHFRPQLNTLGLQEHRDDGFITILRSINPGLEIFKNNEWIKLKAEPDYFKINFGLTMQILTKNCDIPVSAVLHRVIQQVQGPNKPDRWSWGHFSSSCFDTNSDRGIYTFDKSKGLIYCSKSRDHINQNDNEIYK